MCTPYKYVYRHTTIFYESNFMFSMFVSVDNFYLIESCLFDWWIIFEVMMGLKNNKKNNETENEQLLLWGYIRVYTRMCKYIYAYIPI